MLKASFSKPFDALDNLIRCTNEGHLHQVIFGDLVLLVSGRFVGAHRSTVKSLCMDGYRRC